MFLLNTVVNVFPRELALHTMIFLVLSDGYRILVIPLYAYRRFHLVAVYIPTEIARDSLFPFHEGDELTVTVDAKRKQVILAIG